MAAHRTIWSKVVKFGTLIEGQAKRPWRKFDVNWAKGGATVENANFEHVLVCKIHIQVHEVIQLKLCTEFLSSDVHFSFRLSRVQFSGLQWDFLHQHREGR